MAQIGLTLYQNPQTLQRQLAVEQNGGQLPIVFDLTPEQFAQLQNSGLTAKPIFSAFQNSPQGGAFSIDKLNNIITQNNSALQSLGYKDTYNQVIDQNGGQTLDLNGFTQKLQNAPTTGGTDLQNDTNARQQILNNAYQRNASGQLESIGQPGSFFNGSNQNPTVSASTQNTQSAGQPQFTLGADGKTVYDQNGNYVPLDQYKQLTGQTNVPDAQLNWSYVSRPGSTGGNTTGSTSGSLPDGSPIPTTGDPQYDALLKQMNDFLTKLTQNGQTINPNVQITPDKLAEFTQQAVNQIHPYFATQLQAATDSFLSNLGYNVNQLNAQVQKAQTDYGRNLESLGSNMADQGFALSGIRQKKEGQLASDTQYSLDQARNSVLNSAQNTARSFAQQYGGSALSGLTTPTLGSAPRVLPGVSSFDTSGTPAGVYSLSPDIYSKLIGSEQNTEKQATDTLSSQLASNYQTQQANQQARSLNLT